MERKAPYPLRDEEPAFSYPCSGRETLRVPW